MISQDYLKTVLSYNPDTGVFTWLKASRFKGMSAGTSHTSAGVERTMIMIDGKQYNAANLSIIYMEGFDPKFIKHLNNDRTDCRYLNLKVCNTRLDRPPKPRKKSDPEILDRDLMSIANDAWIVSRG